MGWIGEKLGFRPRRYARLGALGVTAVLAITAVDASQHPEYYGDKLTWYGLPGAELVSNTAEARDMTARRRLLDANQAQELARVDSRSGIHVEVYQSMLGDNPAWPLTVDAGRTDAMVGYIIDHLGKLQQPLLSSDEISGFQRRAAAGQLDNITIALLLSSDPNLCIATKNAGDVVAGEQRFLPKATAENCVTGNTIVASGEREFINPTVIVAATPDQEQLKIAVNLRLPGGTEYVRTTADDPQARYVELTDPIDGMFVSAVHETAHAVVHSMIPTDLGFDMDAEHRWLVTPTQDYVTAYLSGLPGMPADLDLENPFGVGAAA